MGNAGRERCTWRAEDLKWYPHGVVTHDDKRQDVPEATTNRCWMDVHLLKDQAQIAGSRRSVLEVCVGKLQLIAVPVVNTRFSAYAVVCPTVMHVKSEVVITDP